MPHTVMQSFFRATVASKGHGLCLVRSSDDGMIPGTERSSSTHTARRTTEVISPCVRRPRQPSKIAATLGASPEPLCVWSFAGSRYLHLCLGLVTMWSDPFAKPVRVAMGAPASDSNVSGNREAGGRRSGQCFLNDEAILPRGMTCPSTFHSPSRRPLFNLLLHSSPTQLASAPMNRATLTFAAAFSYLPALTTPAAAPVTH